MNEIKPTFKKGDVLENYAPGNKYSGRWIKVVAVSPCQYEYKILWEDGLLEIDTGLEYAFNYLGNSEKLHAMFLLRMENYGS